jgi:hypothetical protein
MKPSELYKLWAPEDSIWSNWAKPVLFAENIFGDEEPQQTTKWLTANIAWAPAIDSRTAVLLDLPGSNSVWYGTALSQRGYRPVPLYNGVRGPVMSMSTSALVSVDAIILALHQVGETMAKLQLPANAPPVFLLDSARFAGASSVTPGRFDNRWWIFPQDFPSANFLLSRGIRSVVLGQAQATGPHRDLAHVLLRWQEAGIQILACSVDDALQPSPITVERPANFRSLWYRALVLAGLRRNSAGGFGAVVPEPNSGGGYG